MFAYSINLFMVSNKPLEIGSPSFQLHLKMLAINSCEPITLCSFIQLATLSQLSSFYVDDIIVIVNDSASINALKAFLHLSCTLKILVLSNSS